MFGNRIFGRRAARWELFGRREVQPSCPCTASGQVPAGTFRADVEGSRGG